ncbi:hypothetical protein [Endozoicomonas acroporae]|uniref:hypothetical protein n=1 Tax=Endozoicomonas acroporae TaxID=1701104 RepID=UPI0013D59A18|nr:hypothetical protein [Endozoicomonas acroporae]
MDHSLPDLTKLLSRPIAFQRPYAEIAGSAAGGLFLSQAVYWSDRSQHEGGWFYISQEQWHEQTMLKRSEQERARKELRKTGVLKEERKGNPARLWYQVDKKQLNALLYKAIEKQQIAESSNQDCRIQQSRMQDSAHSLTENITESNTDKTDSDTDAHDADALDGDFVVVRDEPVSEPDHPVTDPDVPAGIFGSHLVTHCHPYLYWFLRCMEEKAAKNPDALGDFAERLVQFGLTGSYCQKSLGNFLNARQNAIDTMLLGNHEAPDHELMEELVDGWAHRAGEFIQEAQEVLSDHLDYLKQQMAA